MANNRICLACGKSYEYCGSCPSSLNLPVWKNLFDTENCKTVFETTSDYAQNVISKEKAKEKISKCNILDIKKYKPQVRNLIEEITKDNKIVDNISETKYVNKRKNISTNKNNDWYMRVWIKK